MSKQGMMFWAWNVKGLSSSEKLALLFLADAAKPSGAVNPISVREIAKKIGLSDRSTRRLIESLCKKGFIGKQTTMRDDDSQGPNAFVVRRLPVLV